MALFFHDIQLGDFVGESDCRLVLCDDIDICSPDEQSTLTPVSNNQSGLQSQGVVKQTALGKLEHVFPRHGSKGQTFPHLVFLSSSIGLWLPQSTAIPAEFKNTGIFSPHLVTTAQTASG